MGAALLMRFWPQLVGGLAVVALMVGIYQAGVNAERKRGEAATLRVELQTMRRDKEIAERALVRVADDIADLAAAKAQDEERIDALQQILDERVDAGIDQRELDGLLNIR